MTFKRKINKFLYRHLPLKTYIKVAYYYYLKEKISIDNPQKFNEKLWWLAVYNEEYLSDLIFRCSDKYLVREYLKEKGCEKYLNELYGVYNSAEEIDFEQLPDKFVLKITQSTGYNIICKDKSKLNIGNTIKQLNQWLYRSNNVDGKDMIEYYHYRGQAKIICEKFLETEDGGQPLDIRAMCFNGKPKLFYSNINMLNSDGQIRHDFVKNMYNDKWEFIPVDFAYRRDEKSIISMPDNFNEIQEITKKLSEDFPFVRVDLYIVHGKIYFGELTWIPDGGIAKIDPIEYDYIFGQMLKLPDVKLFDEGKRGADE